MLEEDRYKKAQEGDITSIDEICSATWESVYRYVYYKVQNREEAEDITQETYVKVLSYSQKSTAKIEKYISFLKAVSMNVLRDRWRKRKHQEMYINIEEANLEEASSEDLTEMSAQRALIEHALNNLNEDQRKVVELRILKGYSTTETARMMSKKEGTIRVLQYRALQNLEAILKDSDSLKEV